MRNSSAASVIRRRAVDGERIHPPIFRQRHACDGGVDKRARPLFSAARHSVLFQNVTLAVSDCDPAYTFDSHSMW
ncbi:hypothetical protein ABQ137_00575 [Xanthomonas sp. WHRI 8393]|uniref:hypothetical protein n=1 Tax=Xanthomonas sp. WHRI 8393 TaxID=3161574 RepID=UPI0032E8843F